MNEELEGTVRYIGASVVCAKPMTRGEYNIFKGFGALADEGLDEAGYIVQYEDTIFSWSQAPQFEEAYAEMLMKTEVERETLNFASASTYARKSGEKIARAEWGFKYKFVFYADNVPGFAPFLAINTGDKVIPWFSTPEDLDANDWYILTEEDIK